VTVIGDWVKQTIKAYRSTVCCRSSVVEHSLGKVRTLGQIKHLAAPLATLATPFGDSLGKRAMSAYKFALAIVMCAGMLFERAPSYANEKFDG
jgi:hypothetical protein